MAKKKGKEREKEKEGKKRPWVSGQRIFSQRSLSLWGPGRSMGTGGQGSGGEPHKKWERPEGGVRARVPMDAAVQTEKTPVSCQGERSGMWPDMGAEMKSGEPREPRRGWREKQSKEGQEEHHQPKPGRLRGLSDAPGWHLGMCGAALRRGSGPPGGKSPRQWPRLYLEGLGSPSSAEWLGSPGVCTPEKGLRRTPHCWAVPRSSCKLRMFSAMAWRTLLCLFWSCLLLRSWGGGCLSGAWHPGVPGILLGQGWHASQLSASGEALSFLTRHFCHLLDQFNKDA